MKLVVRTAGVLAFSAGSSYADILRSVELTQDDLKLPMAAEEKGKVILTRKVYDSREPCFSTCNWVI